MTFSESWFRQVFGAAGASLLIPFALMLAAGVVAAGSGFGGVSSLGQLTSGPTLPASDLATDASSLGEADIVGADLSAPATTASAGGTAATGGNPGIAGPGGTSLPSPLNNSSPLQGVGGGDGFSAPEGPAPAPTPTGGGGAAPVADVVQTTGGLADSLTQPVAPVTDDILDLLVPPDL